MVNRADDPAALAQINSGWSGAWEEIHSTSATEDFSGWEDSSGGAFSRFTVQTQENPRGSTWTLEDGRVLRITLEPGMYTTAAQTPDGKVGAATSTQLTGAEVRSPSDWRFWLLHTSAETGEPEECSEVYRVGDVLVWANWLQLDGEVRRVLYSVSKREGDVPDCSPAASCS